jgi:hypothetical protein
MANVSGLTPAGNTKELPLNDEGKPAPKLPRRVTIALGQLNKRRNDLLAKRRVIDEELEGLDAAILALDK